MAGSAAASEPQARTVPVQPITSRLSSMARESGEVHAGALPADASSSRASPRPDRDVTQADSSSPDAA